MRRSPSWPAGCGGAGGNSISSCRIATPATTPSAWPGSPSSPRDTGVRPLATNDVHYHHPDRRPLQDVVTCIREHARIAEAAPLLFANAERHLKPPEEMARLFRDHPQALESSLEIVERCRFSLGELAYDYPVQDSLRRPHARPGAGAAGAGRGPRGAIRAICRRRWSGSSGTSSS